jgi:hypothetical protein
MLPPASANDYWINIVHRWASSHALAIEQTDPLEIQVAVSRGQLLQFIDDVFWRKEEARDREDRDVEKVERLRELAFQFLRDDETYLIVADEF